MLCIEPVKPEHAESLHAAIDSVAKEVPYLGIAAAPPINWFVDQLHYHSNSGHPFFVALVEQKLVGWCSVIPIQIVRMRYTGQLYMGVLRGWRGHGIGESLLNTALGNAWENGLCRVELEVCRSNTNAVRLYKRLGFVLEGVKRRAFHANHEFDDLLCMALLRHMEEAATASSPLRERGSITLNHPVLNISADG
ncbi:GNAT family N-acetyltransferase [Noviherbaspirillum sp.]|uniref:GNAT family N-acetyltransferase n=1 Tax=Noviherbaspirillum sp. TaxID=1926288 RepID=UPI002B461954|nr:GNAT family N-acetyltransferase [Noviherbaspirillum sp.]HJV80565.1 GNAT family N-acetyltransferase [Noviherbaspirillum sp.]